MNRCVKNYTHPIFLFFISVLIGLILTACTNPLTALVQEMQARETSPMGSLRLDDGSTINDNGNVFVGTASATLARDLNITITNSGKSPLVIDFSKATIVNGSGTEAGTFTFGTPLPTSIAAKSTGTLLVHFLPLSIGTKNAKVTLPTNALASPKITFTLEGNAVNNTNDLLGFGFNEIYGIITGTSITITLPHSYNVNLPLKADFSTNGSSVTVNGNAQTSGVTTNNFASPVMYTVTAADGTTKTYTVTVSTSEYDLPDVSLTLVNGVTAFGASATGSVDNANGGTVTARGFCWSTNQYPTILDSINTDGVNAIGSFSHTITALTAGTMYYVRAWATTQAGTAYSSNQTSFTTIPPAPTGLAAGSTGTTNTVTWTEATGATSYNLYWANSSGVTTSSTKIAGVTSPRTLNGLDWTKAYYYILTAVNAAGESVATGELAVTALPTVPGGISAATNSTSQITVSWSASSGATTYNLYWSTSPDVTTASSDKMTGLTGISQAVTGLTAGTTYYFIVTALNVGGETGPSDQVSKITIPPAPAAFSQCRG